MSALDFKRAFSDLVLEGQREWDRSASVGASEVFGCHRRVFFLKFEPDAAEAPDDPNDIEWGYSERGNFIERKFAIPKLKAMFGDQRCYLMDEEQTTFKKGNLSATPDGMITDVEPDALTNYGIDRCSSEIPPEIKSFDPRMNLSRGAKPRHIGQSIVQQGIFQDCTNYKPTHGVILYINCSNLKDVRPFVTEYDHTLYRRAHERADAVFAKGAKAADFKAEGQLTGECPHCPFLNRCNQVEMARFPNKIVPIETIDPEKVKVLETQTRKVAQIRAQEKEIGIVKKVEEATLKDLLFEIGTTRESKDDWSVSVSKVSGRKILDKDAMLADGIDLEKYTIDGNPYFVMRTKG